jgi:hypothetical protein
VHPPKDEELKRDNSEEVLPSNWLVAAGQSEKTVGQKNRRLNRPIKISLKPEPVVRQQLLYYWLQTTTARTNNKLSFYYYYQYVFPKKILSSSVPDNSQVQDELGRISSHVSFNGAISDGSSLQPILTILPRVAGG